MYHNLEEIMYHVYSLQIRTLGGPRRTIRLSDIADDLRNSVRNCYFKWVGVIKNYVSSMSSYYLQTGLPCSYYFVCIFFIYTVLTPTLNLIIIITYFLTERTDHNTFPKKVKKKCNNKKKIINPL